MKLYLRMLWASAKPSGDTPIDTTMADMWLIILNLIFGIGFMLGAAARTIITHDIGVGVALFLAGVGFVLLSLHVETRARIRSLTHVCTKDCQ